MEPMPLRDVRCKSNLVYKAFSPSSLMVESHRSTSEDGDDVFGGLQME